jgi:hypothetical protein
VIPLEVPVDEAFAKLGDVAWRGLAGRYRDVVSPCTEAPDAFHLGSFLAAVGCLIGRKAWICTPHKTYPNFYCLLVGKTGHTRKTTAYQFALNLLSEASDLLGTKTKRLNGLASVEGLAAAMYNDAADEPIHVLCVEDEFKSLVTKSGQRAVRNIIPKVTELFNCPSTFEVNTRKDPILVKSPFLCMLAASTQAWFEESLSGSDVSGGFLNRWLLFEGGSEKLLPFPPAIDEDAWADLVLDIYGATQSPAGLYEFSEGAKRLYRHFYRAARRDHVSEATARLDLHAKKLGLVYAVLAAHSRIEDEDIASGIAVAEYCAAVAGPLAARLDLSPQKRLEERLLAYLENGAATPRDTYRHLHVSATDCERAAKALETVGQLLFDGVRYVLVKE